MTINERDKLAAARMCLDFTNTLAYRYSAQPVDNLSEYSNLLGWSSAAGLVDAHTAQKLERQAASHPGRAGQALASAIRLREILHRILAGQIACAAPQAEDLHNFNRTLGQVLQRAKLSITQAGLRWGWSHESELERAWWPVVPSAAGLLTSPELLARLGQCADENCGWLFFDTSKNRSRKWCDINDCGNRAKQRRFQSRKNENRIK